MKTRESSGPRMEPWGTPPLVSAREECWPFQTTLGFLLLRESVNRANKFPETMLTQLINKTFVPDFVKSFREVTLVPIPSSKQGKIS